MAKKENGTDAVNRIDGFAEALAAVGRENMAQAINAVTEGAEAFQKESLAFIAAVTAASKVGTHDVGGAAKVGAEYVEAFAGRVAEHAKATSEKFPKVLSEAFESYRRAFAVLQA